MMNIINGGKHSDNNLNIQMHFCDTGYGASGYYKTQILGNYYTRK